MLSGTPRLKASSLLAGRGTFVRLSVVVLAAVSLAACAQSKVATGKYEHHAVRQASLDHDRSSSSMMKRRVAAVRKQTSSGSRSETPSHGVASYYSQGTKTASGERFNALELTAAHPTLPFGTKLRVTNLSSGRSVTVRVNDRGPFVHGRVVDVSYSAADALGMVGKGVAKVKLDVVE
jgi:rare lipoprotein A